MSKFEKELEKNMELNKVAYAKENFYSNFLVSKRDIERIFHDWQPPKPLVVVPQFVSDWFDINQDDIDVNIKSLTRNIDRKLKIEWSEMERWFMYSHNKPIETLISMKLYGYTVEKEKKYILKHIDMSEQYKNESVYLSHSRHEKLKHEYFLKDDDMSEIKQCHFTQEEIDKLNIGSYEQIPVEMSDNGI